MSRHICTDNYTFAGQRIAMRSNVDVLWLHGDMLGSASVATDANGNKIAGSDARYMPFGEVRQGRMSAYHFVPMTCARHCWYCV